jgi:hypothetical protein
MAPVEDPGREGGTICKHGAADGYRGSILGGGRRRTTASQGPGRAERCRLWAGVGLALARGRQIAPFAP